MILSNDHQNCQPSASEAVCRPVKTASTKAAEHRVKHSTGKLYLHAKVAGKHVRISLSTSDLRIAKLRRDAKLEALSRNHAVGIE